MTAETQKTDLTIKEKPTKKEKKVSKKNSKKKQKTDLQKPREFQLYDVSDMVIASHYLKLEMGETRIHFITPPVIGKEVWIEEQDTIVDDEGTITLVVEPDKKTGVEKPKIVRNPYRFDASDEPDESLRKKMLDMKDKNKNCKVKIFWAALVFNKSINKVQLFIIGIKTITDYLADRFNIENKDKYTNPALLDFQITKVANNGGYTQYGITHLDKNIGLTDKQWGIVQKFPDVNLKALLNNKDPFLSI